MRGKRKTTAIKKHAWWGVCGHGMARGRTLTRGETLGDVNTRAREKRTSKEDRGKVPKGNREKPRGGGKGPERSCLLGEKEGGTYKIKCLNLGDENGRTHMLHRKEISRILRGDLRKRQKSS